MKIYIEREITDQEGNKAFEKVKEVSSKEEALKDEWVHECYHDKEPYRPCRRYKK